MAIRFSKMKKLISDPGVKKAPEPDMQDLESRCRQINRERGFCLSPQLRIPNPDAAIQNSVRRTKLES